MLFTVLAKKSYARNLQFRGSHAMNTVASAIFGFIFVSIWSGVGEHSTLGDYGVQGMINYVAFNQSCLWITVFLVNGLGIEASVRSGQIALDVMRPAHLFYVLMCREWGQIAYQAIYKSLPIYLLYVVTFSMYVPSSPLTWLLTGTALLLASYISICIQYVVGIAALWTTESRFLVWVNFSISMLLSGYMIPLEWLPNWLQSVSKYTFYPFLQYHPTRIYLGYEQGGALFGSLLWCAIMTAVCFGVTAIVRKKLEVQGG